MRRYCPCMRIYPAMSNVLYLNQHPDGRSSLRQMSLKYVLRPERPLHYSVLHLSLLFLDFHHDRRYRLCNRLRQSQGNAIRPREWPDSPCRAVGDTCCCKTASRTCRTYEAWILLQTVYQGSGKEDGRISHSGDQACCFGERVVSGESHA